MARKDKLSKLDRIPQVGEMFAIDVDELTFFTCVDGDRINWANNRNRSPNFDISIKYKKYHYLEFI